MSNFLDHLYGGFKQSYPELILVILICGRGLNDVKDVCLLAWQWACVFLSRELPLCNYWSNPFHFSN